GLITPSLDEMVVVAKEMTRRDFSIPLVIGGATTSKQPTAVRIAPAYDGTTVHVLDASRVIGVVSDLLDDGRRQTFERDNFALQEKLRSQHTSSRRPLLTLGDARDKKLRLPFEGIPNPPFTGRKVVEPSIAELRQQVDHGDDKPYLSLADFIAPQHDHIGAFAVTAGIGVDELAGRFTAEHDDYRAIMVKALADRLAEAFAEYLHELVRRSWYEEGPKQPSEELIAE